MQWTSIKTISHKAQEVRHAVGNILAKDETTYKFSAGNFTSML
jgi:hypothetical protein